MNTIMKNLLFLLFTSTIFSVNAGDLFLHYKNCSPISLDNVKPSMTREEIPSEYLYSNKTYNFMALPITNEDERYCLIINNKNKVIVDAIPTALRGMCGGIWNQKSVNPVWITDVAGGRGSVNNFNYNLALDLKKLNKLDKSEINKILEKINCQLFNYTKDDVLEINDVAFYLYQLGYYKDALRILDHVIELDPNRTVAYLNRADTYMALKNKVKAKKDYLTYYKKMNKLGLSNKIPKRVNDFLIH